MIDPKPVRRIKARQSDWADIHELFAGQECVSCGFTTGLELHHITPRSQQGDDVPENLVPLCGACHRRLEDHAPEWEHVAACVRSYVWGRQSRLNYVIDKIGLERFDRRYPAPPWLALGDLDPGTQPEKLPE